MSLVAETTARPAETVRVTRSRRNVAWTGAGALIVVVVLALLPYIVCSGTTSIIVQGFIVLTLASMWNLPAGNPGRNVRHKSGLNRAILAQGWGLLVRRLQDKAPGRIEKINPHYTSQRCSACGHVDPKSRKSQARFACTACGFTGHADVNAARNIAAGHPTRLPSPLHPRGGDGEARPVNREPQLLLQKPS